MQRHLNENLKSVRRLLKETHQYGYVTACEETERAAHLLEYHMTMLDHDRVRPPSVLQ